MRIWLAIPTMNSELLRAAVRDAASRASDLGLIVHYNGVSPTEADEELFSEMPSIKEALVSVSKENRGVTEALHKMWKNHIMEQQDGRGLASPDDLILYIHDDVSILERGWDLKLRTFLHQHPKAGLVGFGGARGLGDPDLYQKPYVLTQLARRDFVSNMRDAEAHGRRIGAPTRVSTLDGFALGCRREFLDKIGGFRWWPYPHHGYDNGLACMAARFGYEVWVLPIACHHHGGLTATRAPYLEGIAKKFGGDGEIHRLGHEFLYKEFKDVLPLMVES